MENKSKQILSEIKITAETDYFDTLYGITPELRDKLSEMAIKVQKKKNSAIKELNDLIKKHPGVPGFRNYLSTLYSAQGNQFMANEVNRRIRELFPEYVYAYLNEVNIAIEKEQLIEATAKLGPNVYIN